jgi:hypothetical protein
MFTPRFTTLCLALLVGLAAGLVCPATSRADSFTSPPVQPDTTSLTDDLDEESPRLPAFVLAGMRQVQIVLTTMALAPSRYRPTRPPVQPRPTQFPPSVVPVPLVVMTPPRPTERPRPPSDSPGPRPANVPEPGSLVMGIVGSGIALGAWLRKRRQTLVRQPI